MIKAIIFDMDGLMIDSEKLYFGVMKDMAASYNKHLSDMTLNKMMGRKAEDALSIFRSDLNIPATVPELVSYRTEKMKELFATKTEAMPGLYQIVNTFYGKLKLAVATGSQLILAETALTKLDIKDKFTVIIGSDNIINGKPDPEIYLSAINKLSVKPEECVVLEDSENGVLSGKNAGCYVIAVPNIQTQTQNHTQADAKVSDLNEAISVIEGLIYKKEKRTAAQRAESFSL